MRKFLALAAVLALAACGGGGGGSTTTPTTPQNPGSTPTTTPSSKYVTPTFVIKIPPKGSKAKFRGAKARNPKYVSSTVLSVWIKLTADSAGVDVSTLNNNPAITNVNGAAPQPNCASGCTVNGPPSPPGTDSFTVVTYDAANAGGSALDAAQLNNVSLTAGQANPETIVLGAIPITLSLSNVPKGVFTAGTAAQSDFVSVIADDADGNVIPTSQSPAVQYADATGAPLVVTVSDPDTNPHGSCFVTSGTSTCTSGAATSVTLSGPDAGASLAYDGLAENPVTLTASAPGATSGTDTTYPTLNAPVFNSSQATPSGVALTASAEIDLFNTSGTGSTGSESFTESGWTNSPYGQALTVVSSSACSTFATVTAGTNDTTNGTPFTATNVAGPVAGTCAATVGDGLSANSTDGTATLTVTYTTSTIGASAKHRHH